MEQQLVFTVTSHGKTGILTTISKIVNDYDGKWFDSRMNQIDGGFAGIIHVGISTDKRHDLENALLELEKQDIFITLLKKDKKITAIDNKLCKIRIFGNNRPGMIPELSELISEKSINIVEFYTSISTTPVTGGTVFHADAVISIEKGTALSDLQDRLNEIADQLALVIEWISTP